MAYEIEVKAHITAEEYTRLKKELLANCQDKGFDEKHDVYFKKLGESEEKLRLRSSDHKQVVLTYKERHTQAGIETNKELELQVGNLEAAKSLLEALGYVVSFEKTKMVHLFVKDGLHYELAEIAGLGLFIEIEQIVEDEQNIQAVEQAKLAVREALLRLKIEERAIEEQSYKKLMGYI